MERFLSEKSTAVTIDAAVADKLISAGSGDAALLHIYILRHRGEISRESAMAELNFSDERLRSAAEILEKLGLVAPEDPGEEYSALDMTQALTTREDFRTVSLEAERLMGRPLSENDLRRLLTIYDRMELEADTMSLLITHCCQEYRLKHGEGKVPPMGHIENAAKLWHENGVHSPEEAEEYLRLRAQQQEEFSKVTRALGISGRRIAPTERAFVEKWLSMGYGCDMIEKAYDITVTRTGSLAWKYMDAIILNWQTKGITAPEMLEKGVSKEKTPVGDSHERQAMQWLRDRKKQGE